MDVIAKCKQQKKKEKKKKTGTKPEPWGTPQVMSGKEDDKTLTVKEKILWAT